MLNSATQDLYNTCKQFLQASRCQRLLQLQQLGLARYADFLTQIRLSEVNIICVMRFFQNPSRVKFPELQGADLSNLVLDGSNLIRGNLSAANLQGSSLVDADLIFANFTNADLRNANLTGATLNETIWQGAKVENCIFGEGVGLTDMQRQNLILRAARFN
ncbi:pentapeptide repeat-containing protein [Chroococcidiopsis sp. TS-821]|uniref:pentapeptide repeat-containing protein n=1 Tax=Chroococcidiopsis sp. TS-821 TaxID=1378066 RepID=UPI000CEE0E83|nr:pentapeptide repeat-containing protein [Chroococcidiopsis sp. TS-821]PPS45281.1 hypothetical protein B1A85_03195 [Chroococcidiopsis sp. TS-821]